MITFVYAHRFILGNRLCFARYKPASATKNIMQTNTTAKITGPRALAAIARKSRKITWKRFEKVPKYTEAVSQAKSILT